MSEYDTVCSSHLRPISEIFTEIGVEYLRGYHSCTLIGNTPFLLSTFDFESPDVEANVC